MKVLFWSELFWPDISGVSIMGMALLSALRNFGYDFVVVTSHGKYDLPDKTVINNIPIYRFHFQKVLRSRDLSALQKTIEAVKQLKLQFNPDLIHINSSEPSLFFHERTKKASGAPILVSVHMLLTKDYSPNGMFGRVLRSADWVTAVSEAMLEDARNYIPEIIGNSSLIRNSLKEPAIGAKPLCFSPPRILCLGRLSTEKGFDIALDSFSRVLNAYPEAKLIVSGDGPAGSDLRKRSKDLGMDERVMFTGAIHPDQVPELINSSTMVVIPSRWREPFCLVALQAAQMARPVIAANVGGLPEIVAHGKTGLIFEKENSRALADQILYLLNHKAYAQTLGDSAQERVLREFSFGNFIDEYNSVYQSCGYRSRH